MIEPGTRSLEGFDVVDVFPVDEDRWATAGGAHRPMRLEVEGPDDDEVRHRNAEHVEVVAQLDADWQLRVEVILRPDRTLRHGRVTFEPMHDEAGDLGARHLRRLGYGDVLDVADGWLRHMLAVQVLGVDWYHAPDNPGRAGKSDWEYLDIARRYAAACETDPHKPIQVLLEEEAAAGRHATAAQLKARVRRARKERGLLTEVTTGRAGGELTPKALAMIAELEAQEGS